MMRQNPTRGKVRLGLCVLLGALVGPLAAAQVTPGPGLFGDRHFKPPVATQAALPASGNSPGDLRVTTTGGDAGKIWVWTGSAWQQVGGAGGVTAVGGTAPITSTGGATPQIGITAATTGAAGSMSAADKSKLDAVLPWGNTVWVDAASSCPLGVPARCFSSIAPAITYANSVVEPPVPLVVLVAPGRYTEPPMEASFFVSIEGVTGFLPGTSAISAANPLITNAGTSGAVLTLDGGSIANLDFVLTGTPTGPLAGVRAAIGWGFAHNVGVLVEADSSVQPVYGFWADDTVLVGAQLTVHHDMGGPQTRAVSVYSSGEFSAVSIRESWLNDHGNGPRAAVELTGGGPSMLAFVRIGQPGGSSYETDLINSGSGSLNISNTPYGSASGAITNRDLAGPGRAGALASSTAGGDLTGSYPSPTVAPDSVALGTDTTGPYAASGSEAGPATTALALSVDPSPCAEGSYVVDLAADGSLTCEPVGGGGGEGVAGPASSSDRHLAIWDGTAGDALSDSLPYVQSNGALVTPFEIFISPSSNSNAKLWLRNTGDIYAVSDANWGWSDNTNTSHDGGDTYMSRYSAGVVGVTSAIRAQRFVTAVQALSIPDDGTGAKAAAALTASSGYVEISCLDVNGCALAIAETGALQGQPLTIAIASGSVDFVDSAGVTELAGAFAAGADDTLTLVYGSDRWRETARSNN